MRKRGERERNERSELDGHTFSEISYSQVSGKEIRINWNHNIWREREREGQTKKP